MGVCWSTEIISWAIPDSDATTILFYITDIFNSIQGVLIFLLFVCKPRVKKLFVKR